MEYVLINKQGAIFPRKMHIVAAGMLLHFYANWPCLSVTTVGDVASKSSSVKRSKELHFAKDVVSSTSSVWTKQLKPLDINTTIPDVT